MKEGILLDNLKLKTIEEEIFFAMNENITITCESYLEIFKKYFSNKKITAAATEYLKNYTNFIFFYNLRKFSIKCFRETLYKLLEKPQNWYIENFYRTITTMFYQIYEDMHNDPNLYNQFPDIPENEDLADQETDDEYCDYDKDNNDKREQLMPSAAYIKAIEENF